MTDRERGTCQHCERSFQLNKDGTVRHHGDKLDRFTARGSYRCQGAGEYPQESGHVAPYFSEEEQQAFIQELEAKLSSIDMIYQIAREQGFNT